MPKSLPPVYQRCRCEQQALHTGGNWHVADSEFNRPQWQERWYIKDHNKRQWCIQHATGLIERLIITSMNLYTNRTTTHLYRDGLKAIVGPRIPGFLAMEDLIAVMVAAPDPETGWQRLEALLKQANRRKI